MDVVLKANNKQTTLVTESYNNAGCTISVVVMAKSKDNTF